jgi:hypothetical protein
MRGRDVPPKPDAKPLPVGSDDVAAVFFGVGTEELTDKLVEELVGGGWERKGLLEMRAMGARYNRKRHSLFIPEGDFGGTIGGG